MNRTLHRLRDRDREGAAMLVVLFLLLMATATAVYAVQSTMTEIRASGHHRMATQTDRLAETGLIAALAWVDRSGAEVLMRSTARSAASRLDLTPFEPVGLAPTKNGLRLYGAGASPDGTVMPGELNAGVVNAIDARENVLGPRQPYEPFLAVDVYDSHQYVGVIPGYPAGAQGNLKFISATYTARGRARIPTEVRDGDQRFANETASDARARGVSGPY